MSNNYNEINRVMSELISARYSNAQFNLEQYLNPDYSQMEKTYEQFESILPIVLRIDSAVEHGDRITVHGDFDVDGLTAAAIMVEYFKSIDYDNYDVYIPDRLTAGHGITVETVELLNAQGTNLIITVDCGIEAVEPVERAKELGMDIIITDHHLPGDKLPACPILVPPSSLNTPFSGAGIAFKLVQALIGDERIENDLMSKLLQLAMLGTVVDSVPQVGENRIISRLGFHEISENPCTGIASMIAQIGLKEISSENITFAIAPRLSASSRMGDPNVAFELLTTDDTLDAFHLQKKLTEMNDLRKELVKSVMNEIEEKSQIDRRKPTICVIVKQQAKGVTGIVAARLANKYERPAFICADSEDGYLHCSARSGGYCDLSKAFDFVRDTIVSGGGHTHAGGAVIEEENFHDFRMKLNTFMRQNEKENTAIKKKRVRTINLKLSLVGEKLLKEIKKFEPYGPAGMPVFSSLVVSGNVRLIGKDRSHLEMRVCCIDSKHEVRALGWNMSDLYIDLTRRNELDPFEIKYTISENTFRGKTNYEIHLVEIDFHGTDIPF